MKNSRLARALSCYLRIEALQLEQIQQLRMAADLIRCYYPDMATQMMAVAAKNEATVSLFREPIEMIEQELDRDFLTIP